MSDLLQLGQHPDADQLNAFIEHALPAREREETLSHLATCSDCRQIVLLSMPPLEEFPIVEPRPKVTPWFSGWLAKWKLANLAWIAAPALAAILTLTIYLQHKASTSQPASRPAQIAQVHPPGAFVAPDSASPVAEGSPSLNGSRTTGRVKAPRPSASSAVSTADSPIDGRGLPLAKVIPVPGKPVDGPIPVSGGAMAGVASGKSAAPAQLASSLAQRSPGAVPPVPAASLPEGRSEAASLPAPAPPRIAPASTNSTVLDSSAVGSTSSVDKVHTFAASSAVTKSGIVSVMTALPSGQPLLSIAMNLHQRVAIDVHNGLFFSPDDGRHWKAISAPWPGQAISVMTVSTVKHPAALLSFAAPGRFTPGAVAAASPSAQAPVSGGSLSGVITDTAGAVIPDATVVMTESRDGLIRRATSDATGRYLFNHLASGSYRIDTQAPGFAKQSSVEDLSPSQQAVRNVTLSAGQVSQTVTVEAATVQLETQSRSVDSPAEKVESVDGPPTASQQPPVFVITTDRGNRWVSSDGQNWRLE